MDRRRMLIGENIRLYRPVEYIRSSGSQYINLGIKSFSGSVSFSITFAPRSSTLLTILGAQENKTSSPDLLKVRNSTRAGTYSHTFYANGVNWSASKYYRWAQIASGVWDFQWLGGAADIDFGSVPLTLFGLNTSSGITEQMPADLYSFVFNGRAYLPYVREKDGKAGLLDVQNDIFYTGIGGDFSYG